MTRSQTRLATIQEAIELLKRLYREMAEKVESDSVLYGAFAYGTLNGIAIARLELETKM